MIISSLHHTFWVFNWIDRGVYLKAFKSNWAINLITNILFLVCVNMLVENKLVIQSFSHPYFLQECTANSLICMCTYRRSFTVILYIFSPSSSLLYIFICFYLDFSIWGEAQSKNCTVHWTSEPEKWRTWLDLTNYPESQGQSPWSNLGVLLSGTWW